MFFKITLPKVLGIVDKKNLTIQSRLYMSSNYFLLKNVVLSKWTSQQNNFGNRAYGRPFLENYKHKSAYA